MTVCIVCPHNQFYYYLSYCFHPIPYSAFEVALYQDMSLGFNNQRRSQSIAVLSLT
jgi:hypothetical protein